MSVQINASDRIIGRVIAERIDSDVDIDTYLIVIRTQKDSLTTLTVSDCESRFDDDE